MNLSNASKVPQHLTQGIEGLYSREDLEKKLASGRPLRVKLGMDPTAPDIHLGHCVVLRKLRQFQDLGHKAVLIIGDYTARIGDPSGRDTTRPILDEKTIEQNAATYLDQAGKVLDTSPERFELRRNSEWLADLKLADVLRLTGQATVQQMLQRENFKLRLRSETEIIVSEFMYPLMQAYDSVAINADVELGGTDQTFNNLLGRDLMAKYELDKQVVMVMPILSGLDGHDKMSKSKGNYVAITDTADDMFGKLMSIPDQLMDNYYRLLTDLPGDRITSLITHTHPREAKDVLARVIVESFHDQGAANDASTEFRRRFTEHQLPTDIEIKAVLQPPIGVITLVRHVGFAKSNSEARRLIEQGAVTFADQKLSDPKMQVDIDLNSILKVGKRRICKVITSPNEFLSPVFNECQTVTQKHKSPIIQCKFETNGISWRLEITDPKAIQFPNMSPGEIVGHICRKWKHLVIRRKTLQDLASYGFDFYPYDNSLFTIRSNNCVIEKLSNA